ncbi:single-stranded-DNA-specific exonuclease RecJ [Gloeocapsa sp. PCC 73106]|uniref:single-stranded-DNA-specific exonuclease RecJ n=1 Tax=Gloeocapsa sp. PCC 73106 TaxID=102232 RepID=UPI0002ABD0B0|nr:single-stranded-DNA-specific exonuclease RecJ [Gloeocapsa sp. PCC 73106]ELR99210.1 single-stranded-DNA-specific exonuclease RecJ [Gloeocapsa sp. PCC 73106]
MSELLWQLQSTSVIPQELIDLVQSHLPESRGIYGATLLHQRGISVTAAKAFINPDEYQPTGGDAFGQEMKRALQRLQKAIEEREKVTIWGDFDADGITATCVLWEGLSTFLQQGETLDYYIPDRFRESHGLNSQGITELANRGTQLIVTCDTGSNNLEEIALARELGIDIIITDHHTLPEDRPEVISIINPRYFASTHPLYHLSGVAVAYKLMESLYLSLEQPAPESLLDLVAIGLIADLVELKGDCRYLAQLGIKQLQKQNNLDTATRLGVHYLLAYCQRNGDRPTDIGFGIGPRINAVSRIYGESSFLVELLTSKDAKQCQKLAEKAELANTRRKELQKNTTKEVKKKLTQLDLSTTSVIVLADSQWSTGVLGLAASAIAREYHRPTILLTILDDLAMGSARSIDNLDLYELVKSQVHLLLRFGGHPFAAGLSLPVENLPLFIEGINQIARSIVNPSNRLSILTIDLVVTVKELGKNLFQELKLLEPLGMGNPTPRLLLKNCTFREIKNKNFEDYRRKTIQYIKTTFLLYDDSVAEGFPGIWWEHYSHELPLDELCDLVVELDYCNKTYQIRLIDWQKADSTRTAEANGQSWLLDWRSQRQETPDTTSISVIETCPKDWTQITQPYYQARLKQQHLALAYHGPDATPGLDTWRRLLGIAKYLQRTQTVISRQQLTVVLQISDRALELGLQSLSSLGFTITKLKPESIKICDYQPSQLITDAKISSFLELVTEEQFQQQYFTQVPLETVEKTLNDVL